MPDEILTYERLSTPRATYVVKRNGVKVAVVSKSAGGRWGGAAMGSKVQTEGHDSRAGAARAILGLIDAAP